jgi:sugar/nucleoside kinase (ribokinase family)
MPELVGIGSVNVDLIVEANAGSAIDLDDPRLGLTAADLGAERDIDAERSRVALDYLSGFDPIISPGGSAVNVCAAVAGTGAPIAVGHVGVCGTDGPPGFDFPAWFRQRGIDTTHLEVVGGPPGLCLAINRAAGRTLLTTAGVNEGLGRFLRRRADAIVAHLAAARLVHVTSLAGLDDLAPLIDVLDRLRAGTAGLGLRPRPRLSCDPGAIWTEPGHPADADEILARTDQLLVNRREFARLGGDDRDPASIFERWPSVDLVVVKGADRIDVHHRGRSTVETHPNPRVLDPHDIVDDTGAGDAFAAGFLLGQLQPDELGEAGGVELGMDLARIKLGFPGLTGADRFAGPYRHLIEGRR